MTFLDVQGEKVPRARSILRYSGSNPIEMRSTRIFGFRDPTPQPSLESLPIHQYFRLRVSAHLRDSGDAQG